MLDVATAAGSVLAAFGLSGAAGLNAWIPLLAAGLLDRAGQLQLADAYDVIATTPGLIVLGVLFVLDFVGDKVPAIDHLLHAVGSVVHPASGAIVFAGPTETPTDIPSVVLFALGASVAGLAARHTRHDPARVDDADRRGGQPAALARRGHRLGRAQRGGGARAAARRARADRRRGRRGAVVAPAPTRPAAARITLSRCSLCSFSPSLALAGPAARASSAPASSC